MTTLKEYKTMMEGATPAPWSYEPQEFMPECVWKGAKQICHVIGDSGETQSNAQFIAASRNIAPELIRVIELAERKLKNIAVYDLYDCSSVEDTDFQAQCKNMYEYAIDILNEIKLLKGE